MFRISLALDLVSLTPGAGGSWGWASDVCCRGGRELLLHEFVPVPDQFAKSAAWQWHRLSGFPNSNSPLPEGSPLRASEWAAPMRTRCHPSKFASLTSRCRFKGVHASEYCRVVRRRRVAGASVRASVCFLSWQVQVTEAASARKMTTVFKTIWDVATAVPRKAIGLATGVCLCV